MLIMQEPLFIRNNLKDVNIVEKANEIFVHMLGDEAEHYYQDLVDGQLGFGELNIEE